MRGAWRAWIVAGLIIGTLAAGGSASAADWREAPVVPSIGAGMEGALKDRLAQARESGNRASVFAKLGDSITETQAFLQGLACGEQHLAGHGGLGPTIRYFHNVRLPNSYTVVWCGYADSWSRASAGAMTGQTAAWATSAGAAEGSRCRGGESPLACEYRLLRPAWSVVMFGTNDVDRVGDGAFRAAMERIVSASRRRGVIPILSTIPPRLDSAAANRRVKRFNAVIFDVAGDAGLPLINFWRATQGPAMVNQGIHAGDGIHPNVYVSYDCDPFCRPLEFSNQALRYGYNQRNLITIETLDRLRRRVILN